MSMNIAVIGAGIIGVNAAHALADEGHRVTIIDREGAAAGTSQGNAGWIAHTDITPLASPKIMRQVPKFLADPLGPLSIRPSYALQALPWLIRFMLAARPAAYEKSMTALCALQGLALPAWEKRAAALGIAHLIHYRGGLQVFDDPAAFGRMQPLFAKQKSLGIDVHLMERSELRQLEPHLSERFQHGAFIEHTAHVSDPREVTVALFDAAMARGIAFQRGEVVSIDAAGAPAIHFDHGGIFTADAVVLCGGIWSKQLLAGLGESVPLESERGYNVSFPGLRGVISRPITFEGHGFVASALESGLRIGGAVEFAGLKAPPNHARTRAMHQKASQFVAGVPAFENGVAWMGHRPSLPDSLPVIGRSARNARVLLAFGHGHYGLTQSAATADLIAALVADRAPAIDLAPFSAQRF